jgi:copper chaperone CopZ
MEHPDNCHVEGIDRQLERGELEDLTDTVLRVSGMGCVNCATRVRNALISKVGVVDARVDHVYGSALVRHNPEMVAAEDLPHLVESAGNDGRHHYAAVVR